MSIKNIDEIENKIKELEDRIRPKIKYDINNEEVGIISGSWIDACINQAKIDVLKWCLSKKRKI